MMDEILKLYFNDIRALENYLVGFCLIQSIAFLYALEKLLEKIYKHKNLILSGIAITVIANICILFVASEYEKDILKTIGKNSNSVIQLAEKANWFRVSIILFINAIATAIFMFSATNFGKQKALSKESS
jgi:hypothetical protein